MQGIQWDDIKDEDIEPLIRFLIAYYCDRLKKLNKGFVGSGIQYLLTRHFLFELGGDPLDTRGEMVNRLVEGSLNDEVAREDISRWWCEYLLQHRTGKREHVRVAEPTPDGE
jgi:hypothetical protein